MKKYTLITGASEGIGKEFALQLARQKKNLILVARNSTKLLKLEEHLIDLHGIDVKVVAYDLSKQDAADFLFQKCQELGLKVECLINNAGFGYLGDFLNQDQDDLEQMLNLNMVTPAKLCRLFLPAMIEDRSGGIINVASTAAFQPAPGFAAYSATKSFVLSLSEALWGELSGTGVKMFALCPGPTKTEFFTRAIKKDGVEASINLGVKGVEEVVTFALKLYERGEHTGIPGILNKALSFSSSIMPKTVVISTAKHLINQARRPRAVNWPK
jgi:short-subunit dehydrogenase